MAHTISILGYGWVGKPLAVLLNSVGYAINASTTTPSKLNEIEKIGNPFLINVENDLNIDYTFFKAEILIINIPSKNIGSFKNLISIIENSSIKKVIFISSTSVYNNSTKIITEYFQTNNSNLALIEQLFIVNANFTTTIIRFAGLFGYDRKPGNFFKNGNAIPNPDGFVNMIHRDDCIVIISKIIKNGVWGETFNACADMHPTRRDFYTKASVDIELPVPIFNKNSSRENKIISNKKLKQLLNYEFIYSNLIGFNFNSLDC
ncbi:dTDP-glucose 4,6-dehydratase [Lutibacter sp.]|uniref:dTDP-glucose 4,6-dehydratase n=1 Tax=Lutibacter sp. TaxID=1925666 RepID=UPI002735CF53|nr:dTDP-glucose 4,6-dehydratase [Lutibacter sp.]MDP3313210.1 dTDP-glucose 4,6-dehydratase [Lutibacter sp.]